MMNSDDPYYNWAKDELLDQLDDYKILTGAQEKELVLLRAAFDETARLAVERDEVTARTLHLAWGMRKQGGAAVKTAELLESFCTFPTAGEPVIRIVERARDTLAVRVAAVRRLAEKWKACDPVESYMPEAATELLNALGDDHA